MISWWINNIFPYCRFRQEQLCTPFFLFHNFFIRHLPALQKVPFGISSEVLTWIFTPSLSPTLLRCGPLIHVIHILLIQRNKFSFKQTYPPISHWHWVLLIWMDKIGQTTELENILNLSWILKAREMWRLSFNRAWLLLMDLQTNIIWSTGMTFSAGFKYFRLNYFLMEIKYIRQESLFVLSWSCEHMTKSFLPRKTFCFLEKNKQSFLHYQLVEELEEGPRIRIKWNRNVSLSKKIDI